MESMDMNIDFWKGKRVLITGHTGFKGSWLSLWLQTLSAELTGFALEAPTNPSLFEAARVADGMFSVVGDVNDLDDLKMTLSERRPEIVFHMAAQSLVRRSYEDPIETYHTNVLGTANVLEAVRRSGTVRVVIVVTSDKCYLNKSDGSFYTEDDPLGGLDPYSSSKGCTELVTAAYRDSFLKEYDIAVATVRAGNVIGGGDWAKDRLIPDIMDGLVNGNPILIRNPNAVRPWQHVQNPLEGYLLLAQRLWEDAGTFSGAWNFGPPEADNRRVAWITDQLIKGWGSPVRWKTENDSKSRESEVLKLDSSKSRKVLGWAPKVSLEQGLSSVIEWTKSFHAGEDMQQLTLQQILKNQERIAA